MQRTLMALGCALALIGGSALAQRQSPGVGSSGTNDSSGSSITEKAKQAAESLGQKAREAAEKSKEKIQDTTQKAKTGADQSAQSSQGTKSMGASGASASSGGPNDPRQMQRQADADYKSAKAQCEPIQQKSQKTLCEKQATAAHANAEVEIEKAKIAAEGGNTSAMGAGKSR